MNRSVFEGRFLLHMLRGIIRQDDSYPAHRRMNWERLYRLSDYHEIAGAIYLAMLGATERVPEQWGERFFLRYQQAVRYGESYEAAELEILKALNLMKTPALILESSAIRRLYKIPETAANSPLRLYLTEENYHLAKGFLVDLGYETERIHKGFGERMRRVGGFRVEIYHTLPFYTEGYRKNMKKLMDRAHPDRNFPLLKTLSLESSFVFRLAEASYHYCTDTLKIRELLDLYLFFRLFQKSMNQKFIDARCREFGISGLALCLLHISEMWFGERNRPLLSEGREEPSYYDGPESRILSNGMAAPESIAEAERLRTLITASQNKEERAERRRMLIAKFRRFLDAEIKNLLAALRGKRREHRAELPDRQEENREAAPWSGTLGIQEAFPELGYQDSPYRRKTGKKVFWKPRKTEESREEEARGEEARQAGLSEELSEELPDLSGDKDFHSTEFFENEEDQDEEQELLLWEFPSLAEAPASVSGMSGETASVALAGKESYTRESFEKEREDERLLVGSDTVRIKFSDTKSVLAAAKALGIEKDGDYRGRTALEEGESGWKGEGSAEAAQVQDSEALSEEKATLNGREVSVSRWTFPTIEEVEERDERSRKNTQ